MTHGGGSPNPLSAVKQPRQRLPMIAAAGSFFPRRRDFVGRSRLSACLTTARRPRRLAERHGNVAAGRPAGGGRAWKAPLPATPSRWRA